MGRGMKLYEPYSRYSSGQLVAKSVVSLVDNTVQKPTKNSKSGEAKRLKGQHGRNQSRPHNPKVGGSNPSPAIRKATSKWPFLLPLRFIPFFTPNRISCSCSCSRQHEGALVTPRDVTLRRSPTCPAPPP